ncbi:MAG TPA: endolytic transglycosylase MltG [Pyrinomonadaceae bacterium]|nr:endolytic transglycosylase MltG [Pyrinomonadaceae bacterium]
MKRVILAVVLLGLVAAGITGYWTYRQLHTPVRHAREGSFVEIPRGSSPGAIVNKLAAEGVITHKWPLTFYLKISGKGAQLRAGEYDFPSPISPLGVLAKLQEGERRLHRITIVEGWTRWDISNAMSKIPQFQLADPNEALPLMDNVRLISDLDPKATNLEGYLFPDTYEFPPETKATELIEIMVRRFRKEWKPEWSLQALKLDMTPREIVTVASLIETEAKLREERPIVASVIYNRLKKDMALGVDSSIVYASKLAGKWRNDGKVYRSDVDRRSPYNTRIYSGLPPGPIASPGKSCLEAALNPAQTEYLYYVREPSRNDGAHNFYSSESAFGQGVRALREWEIKRDVEAARSPAQPVQ